MQLKLTTWNINSVRLRIDIVAKFIKAVRPDVLCLQETKCPDDAFPRKRFKRLGYEHVALNGQKGYHGVAIVSKIPFESSDVRTFCGKVDSRHISVAFGSTGRIDRDNILRASLWALAAAVKALPVRPKLVFVDGRDRIDCGCDCQAVVAGDALVLSIAAASIVAKVTRDRLMKRLGEEHPGYGFERHMGYSVPEHQAALSRLGPTIHHRRSFAPVAAFYGETVVEAATAEEILLFPAVKP